jgi:hypothetical protein
VKKMQKGAIGTAGLITLGVVGLIVLIAMTLVGSFISAANRANEMENGVKAAWTDNKNVLAQYVQKIQETAQIPSMQAEDLGKVFAQANAGRYGANGSQAVMQWIKEQNPNLDTSVYPKLMQLIDAGRSEFKLAQTTLIDKKRTYETALGYVWSGTLMHMAGYPKVNLDTYNIVINDYTDNAFKTGKETGPIKLR